MAKWPLKRYSRYVTYKLSSVHMIWITRLDVGKDPWLMTNTLIYHIRRCSNESLFYVLTLCWFSLSMWFYANVLWQLCVLLQQVNVLMLWCLPHQFYMSYISYWLHCVYMCVYSAVHICTFTCRILAALLLRCLSNVGVIGKTRRGFETSRDLTERRLSAWWIEALL